MHLCGERLFSIAHRGLAKPKVHEVIWWMRHFSSAISHQLPSDTTSKPPPPPSIHNMIETARGIVILKLSKGDWWKQQYLCQCTATFRIMIQMMNGWMRLERGKQRYRRIDLKTLKSTPHWNWNAFRWFSRAVCLLNVSWVFNCVVLLVHLYDDEPTLQRMQQWCSVILGKDYNCERRLELLYIAKWTWPRVLEQLKCER